MMWSNFFLQDDDPRTLNRGVRKLRRPGLSDTKEGKIKLAFFIAIVGVTLMVVAVGTEFWVEVTTYKDQYNSTTCEAVHFGLWKICFKKLWLVDVEEERKTCGPAELPGESNCTFFKFFTTGENIHIFHRTTKKELNMAAAIISLVSIVMMGMGSLCVTMALSKKVEFLLKPASVSFLLSGTLILITMEVFRHSVHWLMDSDKTVPLEYEYSWSVACAIASGVILIIGALCFLLLSLPGLKKRLRECCMKKGTSS
ncbi:voltage-dependent calcium channel gamma-6 subunit [Protopterus annectens]|uniref:voltage-dependent calcium channel gamma-6 subunit n=1 Tax=Protopterus annectens TaxID=7888 RepID=UPI001CFAFC50|nr:voltage-dependent calcium channel gamma-6 subunit [Protopterus annectens]